MSETRSHVIELNEFNTDLLRQACEQFQLPNIHRMLALNHGATVADQLVEHQGLDPWVQWVSVHSEVPSQEHGVIRLGDVTKLAHRQIWERLADAGITTGVWGVMNASRRGAKTNMFFFADPWTYSEATHPSQLSEFLALPVYYAKNYLSLSLGPLLRSATTTSKFILKNVNPLTLLKDFFFLMKNGWAAGFDSCFLFASFELISARIFEKYRSRENPLVTFIFINSIAHFQHHQWQPKTKLDKKTEFLFRSIDRILGILLPPAESGDRILIINGLTQKNVHGQAMYCYRQIDPSRFLSSIGLKHLRVEQCMTNDGHVFFTNAEDLSAALQLLSKATIKGEPAFFVEPDAVDPLKIFYQVSYWDEADAQTTLDFGDFSVPFFSLFEVHAERTGAHVPIGDYFSKGIDLPDQVANSSIFSYLWPKAQ
ncbi:hypothetical protein [Herbaspirillum robiniae]|uniref:hypothetical protein n=1 Tax=Herbaspirillum robiniae TaxID=2014887 RepID=UPI003D77FFA5